MISTGIALDEANNAELLRALRGGDEPTCPICVRGGALATD